MAFSIQTKNELARVLPKQVCCQRAELGAILSLDGQVKDDVVEIRTSNAAAARKVFILLKNLYGITSQVQVTKSKRLRRKKKNIYNISLPHGDIPWGDLEELTLPDGVCCRRSFLRGAFLARGSISNPDRGYHLEFRIDARQGEEIYGALQSLGFRPRVSRGKKGTLIYLKEAEQISRLLNMLGAHRALFNWEDVRIMKGMRNQVNRLVNAETANVDKTVQAAMKQLEDINRIAGTIGLDRLPPKLREVAQLRLQHPYASLKELGEQLHPRVSKSAINHRMRKLAQIAASLMGKN
ncbi:MAG: DNA-binding protein WhiA [Limnochordia bacterium]